MNRKGLIVHNKLFIRAVHKKDSDAVLPLSLALCTTNQELLVDNQIIEHFNAFEPGIYIKGAAVDMELVASSDDVVWGNNIYVA